MIPKNKIYTLSAAFTIFVLCVVFSVFNRSSIYGFFLSIFTGFSVPVDKPAQIVFANCAAAFAVSDLCAALIYIYHAVIKRRPL
jgi:threonine/homoserine/homoserine lactone efflux protein